MGIIYIFTFPNGKQYVGQTVNTVKERLQKHKKSKYAIGNAMRKYGMNSFSRLLLNDVPEEELDYWEEYYIKECNSLSPNGYNLDTGGNKNKHASDETRKKISLSQIGGHKNKGRIKPEEERKHLSEINKGKVTWMKGKRHTEEAKKKQSESHKGIFSGENHPMYGKHHREESLKKISVALKGKPWSKARREAYERSKCFKN
jgi:group I intron endonuclease